MKATRAAVPPVERRTGDTIASPADAFALLDPQLKQADPLADLRADALSRSAFELLDPDSDENEAIRSALPTILD